MSVTPLPTVPPSAYWTSTIRGLPRDQHPQDRPHAALLRPLEPVPVHHDPADDDVPVATLPVELVAGHPTTVPLVGARPGWGRVLMPTLPDGAVGWVRLDHRVLVIPHPVHVEIDTRARTLALHHAGDVVTWPVGVGRPGCPTPRGRSFVLADLVLSPESGLVERVLALAAHMSTHLVYGAGLPAVGIHTWPGAVWGLDGSDGSVLVPPDAWDVLIDHVPPGTAVLIR